jgi:broad specificity phosphatase PhoE
MATIVLARHGRPAWDLRTPIAGGSVGEWVRDVDVAPLDPSHPPPNELRRLAVAADCIAGSPLRRSVESAQVLAPGVAPVIDPQFREVYLPTSVRSRLRLPPKVWVFGLRMAWYCGWSPGVESHAAARRRAAAATARLVALTAAHPRVLLIAHGVMNGLIAAQLRRGGWRGPWVRPRRYWAFAVYERPAE